MPSRPWFKMYEGDYIADTLHLTETQDLIYRRLLGVLWIYGPQPEDLSKIAKMCRVDPRKMRNSYRVLEPMLSVSNGLVDHHKIAEQRAELIETTQKRAKAGRKGGQASAEAKVQASAAIRARVPDPDPDPDPDLNQSKHLSPPSPLSDFTSSARARESAQAPARTPAREAGSSLTPEQQAAAREAQAVLDARRAGEPVPAETLTPAAGAVSPSLLEAIRRRKANGGEGG